MEKKILNKIIILFVLSILFVSCSEYEEGYKNGYKEGNQKGYEEGKLDGHQNGWNERQNVGFYCYDCDDVRHEFR